MYLLNRTAPWENILNPQVLDTAAIWVKGYQEALAAAGNPLELWLTETGEGNNINNNSGGDAGGCCGHNGWNMMCYLPTGVAWGGELNGTADRFIGGFW